MTLLSSIVQPQGLVTYTAGENIASGDLVSLYPNGNVYWASGSQAGSSDTVATLANSLYSGTLRPFRNATALNTTINNTGVNSIFSTGGSSYPTVSNSSGVNTVGAASAKLSNNNNVIVWVDSSYTAYFSVITFGGTVVVPMTQITVTSFTPATTTIDVCAIPTGGFAVVLSNYASPYNIALTTYSNDGVQTLAPVYYTPAGITTYTSFLKVAAITGGGFVVAHSIGITPFSAAGVAGTMNTQIYCIGGNGSSFGSNSETCRLITLSNGNFALMSSKYGDAPRFGIFSATTTTITSVVSLTTFSVGATSNYWLLDAVPDSSGGFFSVCCTAYGGYYPWLIHVSSAGAQVVQANTLYSYCTGSIKIAVYGNTVFLAGVHALSGPSQLVTCDSWNWNGSTFTANWQKNQTVALSNYTQAFVTMMYYSGKVYVVFWPGITSSGYTLDPYSVYLYTFTASTGIYTRAKLFTILNSGYLIPMSQSYTTPESSGAVFNMGHIVTASTTSYSLLYTPYSTPINPIGVATAAASNGSSVTVQTIGSTTSRLTGISPIHVDGSLDTIPGNKVTVAGSTVTMLGITPATTTKRSIA